MGKQWLKICMWWKMRACECRNVCSSLIPQFDLYINLNIYFCTYYSSISWLYSYINFRLQWHWQSIIVTVTPKPILSIHLMTIWLLHIMTTREEFNAASLMQRVMHLPHCFLTKPHPSSLSSLCQANITQDAKVAGNSFFLLTILYLTLWFYIPPSLPYFSSLSSLTSLPPSLSLNTPHFLLLPSSMQHPTHFPPLWIPVTTNTSINTTMLSLVNIMTLTYKLFVHYHQSQDNTYTGQGQTLHIPQDSTNNKHFPSCNRRERFKKHAHTNWENWGKKKWSWNQN